MQLERCQKNRNDGASVSRIIEIYTFEDKMYKLIHFAQNEVGSNRRKRLNSGMA